MVASRLVVWNITSMSLIRTMVITVVGPFHEQCSHGWGQKLFKTGCESGIKNSVTVAKSSDFPDTRLVYRF